MPVSHYVSDATSFRFICFIVHVADVSFGLSSRRMPMQWMCKVDTMSLCSNVDLIKLCPLLSLKVVTTQKLVEKTTAILFVIVIVADCEGHPLVIGLKTPLSFGWAYCYNLH